MPRETHHLNGLVADDEREAFTIGEGDAAKTYLLRPMTRDIRRKINAVETKIVELDEQLAIQGVSRDDYYDQGVELFCEGIDVLLEIDTSGESKHRTAAGKLLKAQYQENKVPWSTVMGYYNGLVSEAESVRPI